MTIEIQKDCSYLWRIENFSSCTCGVGKCLVSPYFTVNSLDNCEWQLSIYPEGDASAANQHISCFLRIIKENVSVKECVIDYEISFMNVNCDILKTEKDVNRIFGKDALNWGWSPFIKIDRVKADLKKCTEDTLIVRCCIKNKDILYKIKTEKYNLKWPIKVLSNRIFDSSKHFFCLENILFEVSLSLNDDDFFINICKATKSVRPSHTITGKISLVNVKGDITHSKTEEHTFDLKSGSETWKFPLITKMELLDNISEYLIDGNIFLLCEFDNHCERLETTNVLNQNSESVSNLESLVSLTGDLQNLFSNTSNSDVKLRVNGEVEQLAHRSVLAARSPVFSAMFDREMLENRTGVVDIEDVNPNTLKSFIQFLYIGMMDDMDYDKAIKLLVVADKYQVSSLKDLCTSYLASALCVKNVCEILVLSNMINHAHLKNMSIDYISAHAAEIFPSVEWLEVVEKNAELSTEVTAYIVKNYTITPKFS